MGNGKSLDRQIMEDGNGKDTNLTVSSSGRLGGMDNDRVGNSYEIVNEETSTIISSKVNGASHNLTDLIDPSRQTLANAHKANGNIESAKCDVYDHNNNETSSARGLAKKIIPATNGKSSLDDRTLNAIKAHLTKGSLLDTLEEEVVVMGALRTSRYANERTRYRQNLLESSDVDGEEESFYDRVYREEENYALANEFFRTVVVEAQEEAIAEASVSGSDQGGQAKFEMDKRTVKWLKKAAGLQRPYDPLDQQTYLSDDEVGDTDAIDQGPTPRRLTRGMARSTRVRRRQERIRQENQGLFELMDAISEIEKERGPYPKINKAKQGKKRLRPVASSQDSQDSEAGSDTKTSKKQCADPSPQTKPLVAILPPSSREKRRTTSRRLRTKSAQNKVSREVLVTRILVNGKHIQEDELPKTDKANQKRKNGIKEKQSDSKRSISKSARKRSRHTSKAPSKSEKRKRSRLSDAIHGNSQTTGGSSALEENKESLRIPRSKLIGKPTSGSRLLEENNEKSSGSVNLASKPCPSSSPVCFDPPRRSHTKDIYASLCQKIINCLSGKARSWAYHEFFYSDIDKEWYFSNDLASDVARVGILPSAKLTRREWSIIRMCIKGRPRRFSKRFIFDQLNKRNRHRRLVREQQNKPDHIRGRDVPGPIRVGTTVTAYNKRFRILHRGVVLFYEVQQHAYLVQFERKELGYELCPDSEVASHGLPGFLFNGIMLDGPNIGLSGNLQSMIGAVPLSNVQVPQFDLEQKEGAAKRIDLAEWLRNPMSTVDPSTARKHTRFDDKDCLPFGIASRKNLNMDGFNAQREALTTQVAVIDASIKRKSMILDAIEKYHAIVVDHFLPNGTSVKKETIPCHMEQHYAWLLANLKLTNQSLVAAIGNLKTMYSTGYSRTPSSMTLENDSRKKDKMDTTVSEACLSDNVPPGQILPSATSLIMDSQDIGKRLACAIRDQLFTTTNGISDHPTRKGDTQGDKALWSRISAIGSLLFTTKYCCDSNSRTSVNAKRAALQVSLDNVIDSERIPTETSQDNLIGSLEVERSEAIDELKEALRLLSVELAACQLKTSLDKHQSTQGIVIDSHEMKTPNNEIRVSS